MFHVLHRIWIGLVVILCAVVGWLAFEACGRFTLLADAWTASRKSSGVQQSLGQTMTGTGTEIVRGDTFKVRTRGGEIYLVQLTGLAVTHDTVPMRAAMRGAEMQARERLRHLVISNTVHVRPSFEIASHAVLGLASVNGTNLNRLLLENGLARTSPAAMNGLPFAVRYAFLRAERSARDRRVGIWSELDAEVSPHAMAAPSPSP